MLEIARNTEGRARWVVYALLLGLYISIRGYHSHEGDQAYRLPLLIHQQDAATFADDPFVRAFDTFNPHRGYLWLLDHASRPFGVPPALAGIYVLTFAITCVGLDRLARAIWPDEGTAVGFVAIALVLLALAGNIGTNHLFEPILVERLIAFALGWNSFALLAAGRPGTSWKVPGLIGLAAWIHPSLGLQLALLIATSSVVWGLFPSRSGESLRSSLSLVCLLGLALVPSQLLVAEQSGALFRGLAPEHYRLIAAFIQSPQHMIPHLWRLPQWLAFACYPLLALLTILGWGVERRAWMRADDEGVRRIPFDDRGHRERDHVRDALCWTPARVRFATIVAVNLVALAISWAAIEVLNDVRVTIFQPFRLATVARGLALVVLAGRLVSAGRERSALAWSRIGMLAFGLTSDWMLVVATAVECTYAIAARFAPRLTLAVMSAVLGGGIIILAWRDTRFGWMVLPAAAIVGGAVPIIAQRARIGWSLGRLVRLAACAWVIPICAGSLPLIPAARHALGPERTIRLVNHCRVDERPVDDIERLAVWCRTNTPVFARFIGPPGPKTFRLWSRRSLAFNQAGSPYHAKGLFDWYLRYRDHIRFESSLTDFVHLFLHARLPLELRYDDMSAREHAALARRQGASYVIRPSPRADRPFEVDGPLELIHVEGKYAVYRLRPTVVASAGTG